MQRPTSGAIKYSTYRFLWQTGILACVLECQDFKFSYGGNLRSSCDNKNTVGEANLRQQWHQCKFFYIVSFHFFCFGALPKVFWFRQCESERGKKEKRPKKRKLCGQREGIFLNLGRRSSSRTRILTNVCTWWERISHEVTQITVQFWRGLTFC